MGQICRERSRPTCDGFVMLAPSGICAGGAFGVGRGIGAADGEPVSLAVGRDDMDIPSGKYIKLRVGGSDHFSVSSGTLVALV
jgi:hypothetical protein